MKKSILLIVAFLFILTACEAIFIENISNQTIILNSPFDKAEISVGEISFNWNSIEDAQIYQLQIATPDFNSPVQILTDTLIDKTTFKKELEVNEYEWRVKAKNSGYETEYSTNALIVK